MMKKIFNFLSVLLFVMAISGCATKIKTASMVPDDLPTYQKKIKGSVGDITVVQSVNSQMITLDEEDFKNGLLNSISASGVQESGDKKYFVKADILKLDYPSFAGEVNIDLDVNYRIYDEKENLIAKETIQTKGTCPFSEHFVAGVRFTRAIERAAQKQFKEFVDFYYTSLANR